MPPILMYRKKPVVVATREFTGGNHDEMMEFCGDQWVKTEDGEGFIQTLEGPLHASPGDIIIKGVSGEVYPHKPDIFPEVYEPVLDENGNQIEQ